ncbi:MAG: rRNA maturation RNase YbeY [Rhodospirillales bacterium]|nr:rRNA maturation RNase YbeY [Rhodospirillales bacterium]
MTRRRKDVQVSVRIDAPAWRRAALRVEAVARRAALAAVRAGAAGPAAAGEIAVVLADDAAVRALNLDYRGQDKPTNVLSFPVHDEDRSPPAGAPTLLGDVIIAFGVAAHEAARDGKTLPDHLAHLVVHGVLHLFGHDHQDDAEATRMEALETRILAGLGVADPYRIAAPAPAIRRRRA